MAPGVKFLVVILKKDDNFFLSLLLTLFLDENYDNLFFVGGGVRLT